MRFELTPNEAEKIKAKYPPLPDWTEGSPYSYTEIRWYWNEGKSWPVKERVLNIPTSFKDTICEVVEVIEGGERFPNLERLRFEKRSFSKNK